MWLYAASPPKWLYALWACTGAGDRGAKAARPPPKFGKKYFSGNYYVKFGHFVKFSYIFFGQKCRASLKLAELIRLRLFMPVWLCFMCVFMRIFIFNVYFILGFISCTCHFGVLIKRINEYIGYPNRGGRTVDCGPLAECGRTLITDQSPPVKVSQSWEWNIKLGELGGRVVTYLTFMPRTAGCLGFESRWGK